jgi:hypothetical protein
MLCSLHEMQRGYDRKYGEGLTKHPFEKFRSRVGH